MKQKVLLVEDNFDNSTLFTYLLKHAGYEVVAVSTAEEATKALETENPEILLCDISLPGENGNAFLKKIRKQSKLQNLCAIAVSAFARDEDKERALESGYDFFIEKPIDVTLFAKEVAEIYEKKRQKEKV